jgi:hypothetical protein
MDTLYPASGALSTFLLSGFIPSKCVPLSLTFYKARDLFLLEKGVLGWSARAIVNHEEFRELDEERMTLEKEVCNATVEGVDMAVYTKIRAQYG